LIKAKYHFEQLIDRCKTFLSLDAILELVLFAFLVPHLKLLVVLSEEMSANLVMKHPHDPALPVFNRESDVNARLPSLGVVSDTGRGHFIPAKVQDHLVCNPKSFEIVHKVFLCLLLGKDIPFCEEIIRF
jgi:hypothetical protein